MFRLINKGKDRESGMVLITVLIIIIVMMIISVSIFSYNKGVKKLQISRENKDAEGEPRFAKLGRLLKEEAQAVLPFIQEAIGQM